MRPPSRTVPPHQARELFAVHGTSRDAFARHDEEQGSRGGGDGRDAREPEVPPLRSVCDRHEDGQKGCGRRAHRGGQARNGRRERGCRWRGLAHKKRIARTRKRQQARHEEGLGQDGRVRIQSAQGCAVDAMTTPHDGRRLEVRRGPRTQIPEAKREQQRLRQEPRLSSRGCSGRRDTPACGWARTQDSRPNRAA